MADADDKFRLVGSTRRLCRQIIPFTLEIDILMISFSSTCTDTNAYYEQSFYLQLKVREYRIYLQGENRRDKNITFYVSMVITNK